MKETTNPGYAQARTRQLKSPPGVLGVVAIAGTGAGQKVPGAVLYFKLRYFVTSHWTSGCRFLVLSYTVEEIA
jgi:hypothetical protein